LSANANPPLPGGRLSGVVIEALLDRVAGQLGREGCFRWREMADGGRGGQGPFEMTVLRV
jgi:hypothetical protein